MSAMLPRQIRAPRPRRRMYVAFAVAGGRFVLPAEEVSAVGELRAVTRLPTADPRRLGIVVHRGRAVALVAASEAAVDAGAPAAGHYLLFRHEEFAIPVDELLGLQVEHGDRLPEGFERFDFCDHRPPAAAPAAPALAEASP